VISSPPDGYTLALLSNERDQRFHVQGIAVRSMKDFEPISSLGFFDFILATGAIRNSRLSATSSPPPRQAGVLNVGTSMSEAPRTCRPNCSRPRRNRLHHRAVSRHPEVRLAAAGDIALTIDSYSSMKGNLADKKFRALASSVRYARRARRTLPPCRKAASPITTWSVERAVRARRHPPEIVKTLNGAFRSSSRPDVKSADRTRIEAKPVRRRKFRRG